MPADLPPRAAPLPSLAALLAWDPTDRPDDAHCRATVPLRRRGKTDPATPRVLACHDLAGGYGPDALPQGAFGPPAAHPPFYRFTHWGSVDAAVYFSHARVALPPGTWVDAAHEAGVAVLGTLIFEHEAGRAEAEALAGDPRFADAVAAALASVASWFGFDGWLVNVEAPVSGAEAAAGVARFVARLDEEVTKRAASPPSAASSRLVLWYDALSAATGDVTWRNALCPLHTAPFFAAAASGGVWCNYGWSASDLASSLAVAASAGRPASHVWMGADVWGRGSHGGSGVAGVATAARAAAGGGGASLAVFAPAWAWEGPLGQGGWRARSAALWAGVDAAYGLPARPAPMVVLEGRGGAATAAHWATAFSTGAGSGWWEGGVACVAAGPWFHAGAVDALPPAALQAGWAAGAARLVVMGEEEGGGAVRVRVAGLEAAVVAAAAAGAGAGAGAAGDAEAGWAAGRGAWCPGAFAGGSAFALRGSSGAGPALAPALPPLAVVAVPPDAAAGWVAARCAAAWAAGTARPRLLLEAWPAGAAPVPVLALDFEARSDGGWALAASSPAPLPPGTAALAVRVVVVGGEEEDGGEVEVEVDARVGFLSLLAGAGAPPPQAPPTLAEATPSPAAGEVSWDAAAGVLSWTDGPAVAAAVRWWEVWGEERGGGAALLGLTRAARWRGQRSSEGGHFVVRARFVDGSAEAVAAAGRG